jgi:hypothetical protein
MPFVGPFTGAEALHEPFSRTVFHVRASCYDETALRWCGAGAENPEPGTGRCGPGGAQQR